MAVKTLNNMCCDVHTSVCTHHILPLTLNPAPCTHNTNKQVPKMLPVLRHVWAPSCMIVSFKLETDESILLGKVRGRVGGGCLCT